MSARRAALSLALAAAALSSSGCFLVAAGAGAGAAAAYDKRGANAQLAGTVNANFDKAVAAFGANSVSETGRGTEKRGDVRILNGMKGELEVTVRLERVSESVTSVEVIAKKNVVEYDRSFAKQVLDAVAK
ncbi:DUF3568 family protein [Gemmatimonas sp.]|uniref:DUF3568 family protein n=1 Tax=Gemmatimonas sp. TaxID=1962908 RepID=UPI0022C92CEF|nr:DUF3568 family protein [Gemmatimonas sp.]MCZ8203720.1 hypothetical protein [Gemmatimonas sp.]